MTAAAVKRFVLALVLAAAAPGAINAQTTEPAPEPRSCAAIARGNEQIEAGMRSCDQSILARLETQCQRDQKRLPQGLAPRDGGRS